MRGCVCVCVCVCVRVGYVCGRGVCVWVGGVRVGRVWVVVDEGLCV